MNRLQEILDKNEEHPYILFFISILISFVLNLIDFILEQILELLTNYERQITYTNFYLSYSIKLAISSSLNSALVPFLSEIIFTKSKRYEVLIGNLFVEFLFNAFITPILITYNYSCIFKKLKQCLKIRILVGKNGNFKDFTTQKELNELYELSDMDISSKYSYIAKTVLMSFFYIPIFPLGIIISLSGFCFFYWLEKFNFAQMYKRPKMINRQIAEFYNNFFIISLFVYAVGDYFFLSDIYETKTWSIVNISAFSFLIIIPYHTIFSIDYIKFKKSHFYNISYDDACINFDKNYEIVNPMTCKEGIKKHLEKLKASRKIDENININQIANLDNSDILDAYYQNISDSGYIQRKSNYNLFGKNYFNYINNNKNKLNNSCIEKK